MGLPEKEKTKVDVADARSIAEEQAAKEEWEVECRRETAGAATGDVLEIVGGYGRQPGLLCARG